ncbi:MAG: Na/Pi cotransporter [marine bacterium B5-7]|nr:MAG: Na/Pi cotransporter [marine bacterium B5-7]
MSPTLLLIHIIGAVTLLLWGMRMVRTGVERALGARLKIFVQRWLDRRLMALLSGVFVTLALQSSTATALLVNSFVAQNTVATVTALAVVLGADIGTTLAAAVLSLDLSAVSPILIGAGFIAHSTTTGSLRQYARATMGLGLVLLALTLLRGYTAELSDSHVLPIVLRSLSGDPIIAIIVFALVTWLLHSSLAAVLFTVSLAAAGVIDLHMALILVLGANLGAGLPAYGATLGLPAPARRVPIGNLCFKAIGVIALIPVIDVISSIAESQPWPEHMSIIGFHIAFNCVLSLVFLPFLGIAARILDKWMPENMRIERDPGASRLLDIEYYDDIDSALSVASRETVRLGEIVEEMYRDLIIALRTNDRVLAKEIATRDDYVDSLHRQIKLYVSRATRNQMSDEQSMRATQVLTFVTDLEHIADIIESSAGLARRKAVRGLKFSDEGLKDLERMHEIVFRTMHLAFDVFMSGDVDIATRLIREKRSVGRMERELNRSHLNRLREGLKESIETSSFHQDLIRDLKRIHSHLVAVAYAIARPDMDDIESPDQDKTTQTRSGSDRRKSTGST